MCIRDREGTVQAAGISAVTIRQDSGADSSFALEGAETEEGALVQGARVRATYDILPHCYTVTLIINKIFYI